MQKVILFVLLLTSSLVFCQETLLRGLVSETRVTSDTLDVPYSIFLPRNYSTDRPEKVLFVFDPSGEGTRAARLFVSSIDGQDFVVVANNKPLYNDLDSLDVNANIAVQIMKDVFLKVAINKNEVYMAGLKSGAQVASAVSYIITGSKNLLLVDDVFYANQYLQRSKRNTVMGVVGEASANYYQMEDYFDMMRTFDSDNTLYEYSDTNTWPSAAFLGTLINRLSHLNAERLDLEVPDTIWQKHAKFDLNTTRNLIEQEEYLTAYDLVTDIKSDYRGNVDLGPIRDLQRSLRRSDAYKSAKRKNKSGNLEEVLLLDDVSYFLEEDIALANFENLGYWDSRINDFKLAAKNSLKPKEQKVAKRMLGYLDYTVNDFLTLNRVGLIDQRIFSNVLMTMLHPDDYQSYLDIINLSAQDEDYNTAYFYLEELLKQGYTSYDVLYEIPNTELLKIKPIYNELINTYLGKSKF